ncbi:MAG TPA: hypothetical protein PK668_21645 [Myxococcota bacterium]|nr:hypothetical protein [Myxococcota bacterium]HRY96083.1 hypothetical protein [Myxococcota bacterium]HSA21606.1 hypothetical protein [Myxococcota bacterium]
MARSPISLCLLLSVCLIPGCLTYGALDPGAGPDGGQDGGQDGDVHQDDSAPPGPCSGPAYVRLGGEGASPVVVTTDWLVMDCCEGVYLTFHGPTSALGPLRAMLRVWGGPQGLNGEFAFDGEAESPMAGLASLESDPWTFEPLAGWARIEEREQVDHISPLVVTLCAHATGEGPLASQGTEVWVERAVLAPMEWAERWQIRLLADPDLSAQDALALPLDSLALRDGAWADLWSLASYGHAEHELRWNEWHSTEGMLAVLPPVGVQGLPFVVVADGAPAYLGAFMTPLSSLSFGGPVILMPPGDGLDPRALRIERSYADPRPGSPDPREDPRVLAVLGETGRLAP